MTAQPWKVITESIDLLRAAAAAISDSNREAPTPCTQWTVTQVLQHAAGDQLAWAAALGVGTGPAENPFAPSGHIEAGIDDLIEPALAAARTAWAGVRSDDDAVPTPLPQGRLQARVAAGACALDAAVHVLPVDLYVDGWHDVSGRQAVVTVRGRLAGLSARTPTPPSAGTLLSRTRRRATRPVRS